MAARGIAIFGTGTIGQRVYRQVRWRYRVECFIQSSTPKELCQIADYEADGAFGT